MAEKRQERQSLQLEHTEYLLDQLHSLLVWSSRPSLIRYYTYHSQCHNESQLPINPHLH